MVSFTRVAFSALSSSFVYSNHINLMTSLEAGFDGHSIIPQASSEPPHLGRLGVAQLGDGSSRNRHVHAADLDFDGLHVACGGKVHLIKYAGLRRMFEEGVGRGDKTCGSADRLEGCLSMTFIATTLPPDDQERQQSCANGLDSGDLPQTSISLYKMPDTSRGPGSHWTMSMLSPGRFTIHRRASHI
jgi:hypothetical protein